MWTFTSCLVSRLALLSPQCASCIMPHAIMKMQILYKNIIQFFDRLGNNILRPATKEGGAPKKWHKCYVVFKYSLRLT